MGNFQSFIHIAEYQKFTFKEKGSEFIGLAFYTETEPEFHEILNNIKKEYYDATHHCYSVKLVNGFQKFSDDGEPNGTAGVRILKAIEHFNLNNIVVIVVRYFGGTKLGTGPLGKAYYTAAEEVLRICSKIKKDPFEKIKLITSHTYLSTIHRLVNATNSRILKTDYSENVEFICAIPSNSLNDFSEKVSEQSNANVSIKVLNEVIFL